MRRLAVTGVISFVILCGCGAAGSGAGGATTPAGALGPYSDDARFGRLEGEAVAMDPAAVAALPEVADDNVLMFLEATVGAPDRDPVLAGFPISPPTEWTIGASEEGEEVRVEFLEPEGGQVVMTSEPGTELAEEVTVTWIVRYERRNVRLTGEGPSEAIHVTPVAARLDSEGQDPMFWISSEAPEPPPE